ncbi:hypothetical protein RQM47_15480 [Rubrivirga sp. S365]|uniref:hypothetical protein n=1 Tax=Rubrivirga sp. S365 TaxID=3076080 RepID=UPI0028C5BEDD|nr:hypothetical protein [Rubrivirga sp. S365]MDT7858048.1 hypothetical protein [Rubrivirga sp. S365]
MRPLILTAALALPLALAACGSEDPDPIVLDAAPEPAATDGLGDADPLSDPADEVAPSVIVDETLVDEPARPAPAPPVPPAVAPAPAPDAHPDGEHTMDDGTMMDGNMPMDHDMGGMPMDHGDDGHSHDG